MAFNAVHFKLFTIFVHDKWPKGECSLPFLCHDRLIDEIKEDFDFFLIYSCQITTLWRFIYLYFMWLFKIVMVQNQANFELKQTSNDLLVCQLNTNSRECDTL